MAFFNSKERKYIPKPIPPIPPYVPPTPPTPPTPGAGSTPNIPRPVFSGVTDVTFYTTYSDNNVVNKALSEGITYNVPLKNDTSVITPVLLIETEADLTQYNYCYIAATQRYYFIQDVKLLNGTIYQVVLNVDVLMSFRQGILLTNGILIKTEDKRYINEFLDDGSFVNQEGCTIRIIHYDNGFTETPSNILITCG